MNSDYAVCELRGVTRCFGKVRAVDNLSLAIRPGQLTAVLGPNGAGKTTAVRLMLGLVRPTAGQVRLFDSDPSDRQARERTGVMLQVSRVPETLTPREHLTLFRSCYQAPFAMDELLAMAGLAEFADARFGTLSGGQRQRVLFAIAICGNPELLFLDEPTVGLDVEARRLLWNAIRTLVRDGRSILLTTHYLEEADTLADRVVVLQQGRIVADGSPEEVKQRVAGRHVRCITSVPVADIERIPGVQSVRPDGSGLVALTTDAEGLTRCLLARDRGLSGLEVSGVGLEEAFVALTSGPAATGTAGDSGVTGARP
jgi:ABC-2 type transport system ATP-binding protein